MSTIQLEAEYLIQLLSSVIHNTHPKEPTENVDLEKLYKLSAYHNVSNMVCYGMKTDLKEVMVNFESDRKKAIAKEATQHIVIEQILKTFEANNIICMPLKGYLIKQLYPKPDMRIMADVDILFKNEQTEEVKKLMLGLGFTIKHQGGNHDVYYKKPFMNIEMHRCLMSENSLYSDYFNKTWDRAKLKAGCKFIYELSKEDFFIYIMAHLTKHYIGGGTGIRSIMDIWSYNNRYGKELDWNYVQTELKQIRLCEFTKNICALSEVWFGNVKSSELYDEMAKFIFSCGVYGNTKHSILSAMNMGMEEKKSIETAMFRYKLRLFFPKFNDMKTLYPVLEMLPLLLPACFVLRGVKCFLFKRKLIFRKINTVYSLSQEDVVRIGNLHKKVGLL